MADQPEQPPPEVHGVQQDQYQAWSHHPVTAAFHQYLRDYAEALRRDHLQRWERGALEADNDQEARGRVLSLIEVADLEFGHMLTFYADQKEDDVE